MGKIPSRGSDQFVVRFPDGLRDQLKICAEANGRSMNAEIIERLEKSLLAAQQADASAVEMERLRNNLAYEQGRNASLTQSMKVFVKYLAKASKGDPISLEEIQFELNELDGESEHSPETDRGRVQLRKSKASRTDDE